MDVMEIQLDWINLAQDGCQYQPLPDLMSFLTRVPNFKLPSEGSDTQSWLIISMFPFWEMP
jgi:hypothetical protein